MPSSITISAKDAAALHGGLSADLASGAFADDPEALAAFDALKAGVSSGAGEVQLSVDDAAQLQAAFAYDADNGRLDEDHELAGAYDALARALLAHAREASDDIGG